MNKKKILIICAIVGSTVALGSSFTAIKYFNNKEKKIKIEVAKVTETIDEGSKKDLVNSDVDNKNQNLENGEFIGEGKGYAGTIKVKVTVKDEKIEKIDILSHSETPSFFEKAKVVLNRIINKNSYDVDGVSGATLTSNGIKEAVSNALKDTKFNNLEKIKKEKNEVKVENIKIKNIKANVINIDNNKLKDGEYIGSAKGFKGNIKINTVIKDGKIKSINILNHNDDQEFMDKAQRVISDVLNKQNINEVDTVSGATYSSKGILEAISQSVSKAIQNKKDNTNYIKKEIKDNVVLKNNISNVKENSKNTSIKENISNTKDNIVQAKSLDINGLKDGEYITEADGFKDKVKVKTLIKNGKIRSIDILEHNEDKTYIDMAKGIIPNILMNQNCDNVDVVSGATYSSNGILNAVKKSLDNAKSRQDNKKQDTKNIINKQDNKKEDNSIINKDTFKPVDTSSFNLQDGEYYGRSYGLYKDKSILTTVLIKNNKIEKITLADGANNADYGDDGRGFKYTASRSLEYLSKDRDGALNDLLEYKFIVDKIMDNCYQKDVKDYVEEGKKYIGDYAQNLHNIKVKNSKNNIKGQVSQIIKKYFDKNKRGQVLNAVSGATYSATGIAKSVNVAINNAKIENASKKYVKNIILKPNTIVLYEDELENNDSERLTVNIEYNDGSNKNLKFKDFQKNNIKIMNKFTNKEVENLKDFYEEGQDFIIYEEGSQFKKNFSVVKAIKNENDITEMEYKLDNSEWLKINNIEKRHGDEISKTQKFYIDKDNIGKNLKLRVVSRNGQKYELDGVIKIQKDTKEFNFKPKYEDYKKNIKVGWGRYELKFENTIKQTEPEIIFNKNNTKTLCYWQVKNFNPIYGIKAISEDGDDITSSIKVIENTLKNKPGRYEIKYSVVSKNGVETQKTRVIQVIDDSDDE